MKPILFNTEMVKAILDNRKTVTRRPIKAAMPDWEFEELKNNPYETRIDRNGEMYPYKVNGLYAVFSEDYDIDFPMVKVPYQPSDVLYVRETWQYICDLDGNERIIEETERYIYAADNDCSSDVFMMPDGTYKDHILWRPSIHMPKEAARIFLRVTDVRVERLQDMRLSDCLAEGIRLSLSEENDCVKAPLRARERYAGVWNSTIKRADLDKYGWDANPWVWVIEFERISKEEAIAQ